VNALFDTNILIDYLSGIEGAKAELSLYRGPLVSIVTWMEVLAGARNAEDRDVIDMFLRDFRIVDVTRGIARDAVEIRRSRRMRLPDAIIWATARAESALLITRNIKDFPKDDPGVRVPYGAAR
jgi:hypothetical protein